MRRDPLRLQVLHDESVKAVVDHPLAVELIDSLPVKRRGVIPELQDKPSRILSQEDGLGFARIKLFTSWHDALTLIEMSLQDTGAGHRGAHLVLTV